MKRARYQISINGFEVISETWDDALEWDGKRDEVFLSWSVKKLNSQGSLVYPQSVRQAATIGDANGYPSRRRGGTGSDRGGLRSGDRYPHDMPWLKRRVLEMPPPLPGLPTFRIEVDPEHPPGRDVPPMICFDDIIADDEIVYFTPSIWEWDQGTSAWEGWIRWHKETDDKFGRRAKEVFGGIAAPVGFIFDAVSLGIQTAATLFGDAGPIGRSATRPIGMVKAAGEPKTFVFNPQVVELSLAQAEALVAADPAGCGTGVLAMSFRDDPDLRGDYQLYVQVERIGGVDEL
jgi:hypothetical protein